jgi:molybdopterin molybdotransferase
MIAAMLSALPCRVTRAGPVADTIEDLLDAFDRADDADLIVTTGGASVGDHDLIRPALERWGASLDFWRVAIKPGKPLLVARRGAQIILGLPGNPVSSHVTALLFLLPLVRTMGGAALPLPIRRELTLGAPLAPGGSRREFLRGVWQGDSVETLAKQDSGGLAALAAANVLIDRPARADALPAGAKVPVILLENG